MQQTTLVEDRRGVHSAHVALHRDGKLVREAAALYLPAGLAGKGGLAALLPPGMLFDDSASRLLAPSQAGSNAGKGAGAAAPVRAVGYVFEGGAATWGLISDPVAAGLPPQQPVRVGSVRPPPWQVLPAMPE